MSDALVEVGLGLLIIVMGFVLIPTVAPAIGLLGVLAGLILLGMGVSGWLNEVTGV